MGAEEAAKKVDAKDDATEEKEPAPVEKPKPVKKRRPGKQKDPVHEIVIYIVFVTFFFDVISAGHIPCR